MSIVDRLYDFVVPYQHALETEAGKRHVPLYLAGLLSHLDRKNAEKTPPWSMSSVWSCKRSSAPRPGIIAR
jgi:hypothetical protein